MRVALIDADHISYVVCHNKKGEEEKNLNEILDLTDKYITNLLTLTEATHYIGALTIGKCFRYSVYPEYKANRKNLVPMNYSLVVKEYLKSKWKFISYPELEADDIINICKNSLLKSILDKSFKDIIILGETIIEMPIDSFIISPDKDMLNLEGKHYSPMVNKWIDVSRHQAQYTFWEDMIVGQPGDNIKGIPGKGKAFATKLFSNVGTYGSGFIDLTICEYIDYFGEEKGIDEFHKVYKCLKIKDNWPNFEIPEPIRFENTHNELEKRDY